MFPRSRTKGHFQKQTRIHSSRMRTVRCSGRLGGMSARGGVLLRGGSVCPGDVCLGGVQPLDPRQTESQTGVKTLTVVAGGKNTCVFILARQWSHCHMACHEVHFWYFMVYILAVKESSISPDHPPIWLLNSRYNNITCKN